MHVCNTSRIPRSLFTFRSPSPRRHRVLVPLLHGEVIGANSRRDDENDDPTDDDGDGDG